VKPSPGTQADEDLPGAGEAAMARGFVQRASLGLEFEQNHYS